MEERSLATRMHKMNYEINQRTNWFVNVNNKLISEPVTRFLDGSVQMCCPLFIHGNFYMCVKVSRQQEDEAVTVFPLVKGTVNNNLKKNNKFFKLSRKHEQTSVIF